MAGLSIEHYKHPVQSNKANLGFMPMWALVVGGIIGSGIFNLINAMLSGGASTMALVISWIITGVGMLLLVLSFYFLNKRRPDLDAGVYSYAQAGFGKFMGFNSAWGYWISAWIGNVAYGTIVFASLNYFIKNVFVDSAGNFTIWTVLSASVVLWLLAWLISRGIKQAGFLNAITTIAKLVPIAVFLIATALAFKFHIFSADLWGEAMKNGAIQWGELLNQVKGTMLAMVFVFIGIEGASVFSGQAKNHKIAGRATIWGFLTVLAVYVLITVLSLGVMSNPDVANMNVNNSTAMAQILESVVGKWGGALISIGVIISVVGAWLAWTLFAMQIPYEAAKKKAFPAIFAKTNKHGVATWSLIITSAFIQIFFLIYLVSSAPYDLMVSLCSSMILVPYLFVAMFQLRESVLDKTKKRVGQILIGVVATIYALWLLYAGGMDYLLTMMVLYAIGIPFYIWMQKEQGAKRVFRPAELVVAIAVVAVGLYALWWLIWGGGWNVMMG